MNMNSNGRKAYIGCWYSLVASIILMVMIALSMCSCTKTEYITVEKVRTDTTYITKQQRDSIWLHDSIHIRERGDTMLIERWHTKYVESIRHDTCYQSRVDSVPVPYPVMKLVEKELSKTQKGLMGLGLLSLIALVLTVGWRVKKFLP